MTKYSFSKFAARARFIGFVFQAYYLAPELNALENVLLGARMRDMSYCARTGGGATSCVDL